MHLSFSGCVFDDLNADGIVLKRDAAGNLTTQEESGFSGVTIRVVDSHGNIVSFQNKTGKTVTSTVTDSRGFYFVYGLANSDYKIQFDYRGNSDLAGRSFSPANVVDPSLGVLGSDLKDSDAIAKLATGLAETGFYSGPQKLDRVLSSETP